MNWQLKPFEELSNYELYQILKRRCDIFVVEQECAYGELDNLDQHIGCLHLMAYDDSDRPKADNRPPELLAYARLLAPGLSYIEQSSIGRVLVAPEQRGTGLGHDLIDCAIKHVFKMWPEHDIKIGAQLRLQTYYEKHDFISMSEPYMEDGIAHIHMIHDLPH